MKILLFGADGQVGWELQRALAPLGGLVSLGREGYDGLSGDLTQLEALSRTVRAIKPDFIVNAAAYTAVDRAESEPELASTINGLAPGILANEAQKSGACLVHYSTDYIFDGSGERSWVETDKVGPVNVYGSTKLQGEQTILRSGCEYLILRTSWVYALRGNNFIKTMLRLSCERDQLQVVNDQFGAPTGAELVADVTAHAIRHVRQNPGLLGTYHLTASGDTSWYAYAQYVIECARQAGWPVRIDGDGIKPVSSTAYPATARRPLNGRLDCGLLGRVFDLSLPDWRIGVARVLEELKIKTELGKSHE